MHLAARLILRIVLNTVLLYALGRFVEGFSLTGGIAALIGGGFVIAVLHSYVRPVVRIITAPLVWITLGLFIFVINMGMLWLADVLLPQLTVTGFGTLLWTSFVIAFVNGLASLL